jgi:hypothetical protein
VLGLARSLRDPPCSAFIASATTARRERARTFFWRSRWKSGKFRFCMISLRNLGPGQADTECRQKRGVHSFRLQALAELSSIESDAEIPKATFRRNREHGYVGASSSMLLPSRVLPHNESQAMITNRPRIRPCRISSSNKFETVGHVSILPLPRNAVGQAFRFAPLKSVRFARLSVCAVDTSVRRQSGTPCGVDPLTRIRSGPSTEPVF